MEKTTGALILAANLLLGCESQEKSEVRAKLEADQRYVDAHRKFIDSMVRYCPRDKNGMATTGKSEEYAIFNICFDSNNDGVIDLVKSEHGMTGTSECFTPDGNSYYGALPTGERCHNLKLSSEVEK